jgi:hypothetical protein
MAWFIAKLQNESLNLKQVEAYEGQFDDPEDVSVFPPAAFVALNRLSNERESGPAQLTHSASVYLVATHVHGASTDAMLDLLDAVVIALHDKPVRYESDQQPSVPPDVYFGRCFLKDGEFIGILPGVVAYRLNFIIKR